MEILSEKETAHLAAIVENSADAIISKDLNGIITSWNKAAANMFGYAPDEAVGSSITILIPDFKLDEEREIISRIKKGEKIEHFETIRQKKNGETFDISLTVSPIKNSKGEIIGASKIARDISDRKRTERELAESRIMLPLAMKSSRMGVWEHDVATGIVQWSPELEEIFGLETGEFPQTRAAFYEMIHEDDRQNVFHAVNQAISERKDYSVEFRFVHKDGSIHWMEGRGQAVYSENGTPVRIYGSGLDITERKESERKLRESEQRFRTLADNISQFAWMADSKGSIFWYNKRWFDYTGTTLEEMHGWGWKKVHHPDHVERVVEKLQKSWDTGEIWEDTFPIRSKTGEYRWFLSRALPIRDDTGNVVRWFGTNTDITERMEAEDALISASRAKDEFLSVLSHELRTPLNAILGWTKILKSDDLDAPKIKRAIETIERNARLQNNLIEDLLDVSRIISGKIRIENQLIDLINAVKSTLETVQPLAEAKNISLEFDPDVDFLQIVGDHDRIQQIVVNLVNNAIKFTPPNGSVILRVEKLAASVKLTVTDTGIGINQDFLPEIFDRFRQADSTTQRNFSGLGLGLTIAKHLIELHGGEISAHSDGDGKGSTFTVELPLAFSESETTETPVNKTSDLSPASGELLFEGKTIVLVDDDCEGMEPLQIYLEMHGASVKCFESASSALEFLSNENYDLLISDIGMPDMDGYDFLRELKKLNGNALISSIALTAFAGAEDRQRAFEAGYSHHLSKPLDYNLLLQAVSKSLDFGKSGD